MPRFVTAARLLLGALFTVIGLNGFVTFIPVPEFHPFMAILVESGYIYAVKTVEVVGGLLLLTNRFVPLALALLAPVAVNVTLYHALLDARNWPVGVATLVLVLFLAWHHRAAYAPLFERR